MPLPAPELDPRRYDDLRTELLARIPAHTPEWTNHNDADPGVTLLELFAHLGDSLLYRLNRVPERSRLAFLRLLGQGLRPAAPARGVVAFTAARGRTTSDLVPPDTEVRAGAVPFRTDHGLDLLPVTAQAYVKARVSGERAEEVRRTYELLYDSFVDDPAQLVLYETLPAGADGAVDVGADTVDRTLWLALVAGAGAEPGEVRATAAGHVLSLGLVPALAGTPRTLAAAGGLPTGPQLRVDLFDPGVDGTQVRYVALDARASADPLVEPAVLELPLPAQLHPPAAGDALTEGTGARPPALEPEAAARVVAWLRVRAARAAADAAGELADLRLAWVGVNAALATQRVTVPRERLGVGTGAPDQVVRLSTTPVLPGERIEVDGTPWRCVEDLTTAPGEREDLVSGRVYELDRESGDVRFGDGRQGTRPPRGAVIAAAYGAGGGTVGHVPAGAVDVAPSLPGGTKVTNPVATWGAADAETVADAERRIPALLRHRDRAVSTEDFDALTRATPGVDLGRVEVLARFDPAEPSSPAPGMVTVLVIPAAAADPSGPPRPDRFVLERVCAHLEPRRLITTEVHVHGPAYVPVAIGVGFETVDGRDLAVVRDAVRAALRDWLSPLRGGSRGIGWPLSTPVHRLEAWAVAARVDGVAHITGVLLLDGEGTDRDEVTLAGLQLPALTAVDALRGQPPTAGDLGGAAPPPPGDGPEPLPVPVVPEEC